MFQKQYKSSLDELEQKRGKPTSGNAVLEESKKKLAAIEKGSAKNEQMRLHAETQRPTIVVTPQHSIFEQQSAPQRSLLDDFLNGICSC